MSARKTTPADGSLDAPTVLNMPEPTHLEVRARSGTFRRCGRIFCAATQRLPLADLSDDEISRLLDEPALVALLVSE